jgi:hypothetical protein
MDRVNKECYGGELTPETMRESRMATAFCKRAPCLSKQSTLTTNLVRTIKDPKIQGRVIEMVEDALKKNADPRTEETFRRKSGAMCISTPMIKWMIRYAETGIRPNYTKRNVSKNKSITPNETIVFLDELLGLKFDRRTGLYPFDTDLRNKAQNLRDVISCQQASQ